MDTVSGRRKRGVAVNKAPNQAMGQNAIKPGSSAFGQMAEGRRETIRQRQRKGDLRVKTAYRNVSEATMYKKRLAKGD